MASINLQGDTSGSISISAPSVAGSNTLTLPKTTQTLATQNALGVRNLIINGDMRIAQRGTSETGITSGAYYTTDRWRTVITSGGTWTETQDTDVPTGQGFAKSRKFQCTTANASLSAGSVFADQTKLEGQNLQHLKKGTSSAEKLTLSFWVKSNKTGTIIAELEDIDNARTIGHQVTIDTADTWEKKTWTLDGDTTGALDNDNGASLNLNIVIVAGTDFTSGTLNQDTWVSRVNTNRWVGCDNYADSTSNYINITGVQLEVGDTATPFEHRPYDMELARCQRYCVNYFAGETAGDSATFGAGVCYKTNRFLGYVQLPTQMRNVPSISPTAPTAMYVIGGNLAIIVTNLEVVGSPLTIRIDADVASGLTIGHGGYLQYNNASEDLILDAEL